jgi:hypothetical protein
MTDMVIIDLKFIPASWPNALFQVEPSEILQHIFKLKFFLIYKSWKKGMRDSF